MNDIMCRFKPPSRATLAVALIFGLFTFAIIESNASIQIDNSVMFIDSREIFSFSGSSFSPPYSSVIITFWAGVGVLGGKWLASILTHLISFLFNNYYYKTFNFLPHYIFRFF
jgi:hypothetical protein